MSLPLEILAKYKVEAIGLDELEGALFRFGMRLRLTGRDYLRLGGTMERFFSGQLKRITDFLGAGELWQAQMEDIQLAVGDIADAFAAVLDPAINLVVDALEQLADWVERNPWAVWLIIIPAIILLLGKVVAKIISLTGWVTLLAGSMLTAHKAGLTFGESIRYLFIRLSQGEEAAKAYLAQLSGMDTPLSVMSTRIRENIAALQAKREALIAESKALKFLESDLEAYAKQGVDVKESLEMVRAKMEKNRKAMLKTDVDLATLSETYKLLQTTHEEEATSERKGWRQRLSGVKGTTKGFLKFVGVAGLLGLLGGFLFTAWEPLQDLFESIADIFADLLAPLAPLVEGLAEWIDENPDLVKWLLVLAIILGIAILALDHFGVFGKIAQKIVGALGGTIGEAVGPTQGFTQAQLQSVLALSALIGAIAALVYAFAQFVEIGSKTGMNVWEMVGALGALFAGVLGFIVGLAAATRAFGSFAGESWKGILALTAVLGAISLLIYTFAQFAVTVSQLEGGVGTVWNMVGALIVLVGALVAFTIILSTFGPVVLIGAAVLLILAGALWIVGAALNLIAGAVQTLTDAFITLFTNLGPNIPTIVALSGALFALGTALMFAGMSGFLGMAGLLAASVGLIAVSAGLTIFAGALLLVVGALAALVEVLSRVPDWARGLVSPFISGLASLAGGALAAIGGLFGGIPKLQRGGIVTRGGLFYLHPGEAVVPAHYTTAKTEIYYYNTFNISGEGRSTRELAEEIARILGRT